MLRPETMHQVSIIVAKDELPNLLSYAGKEQMIHLMTVDDEQLPPGATPFEGTSLLSKSATIRNRISALAAALQQVEVEPEKIEAPIHNIDELGGVIASDPEGKMSFNNSFKARIERLNNQLLTTISSTIFGE